ncbi:MAG: SMC-Scp complex subunit ScpB [Nitriliruptoraceae bacterium]
MTSSSDNPGAADALTQLGQSARCGLEALLFLTDEPITTASIAEVLEVDEDTADQAVEALATEYAASPRGIEIRHAAGGWRMYSSPVTREYIERWALSGRTGRLTQAALETLAVITYKQPISRHDIGEIRGVNADAAVRSLVARGLVQEVGRHSGPGQAVLYGTTSTLLERLGLDSLDELPPLTDYLPEAPAPDEPELGAIREIRRRLAAAGRDDSADPGDDNHLPPPNLPTIRRRDADMDDLTDRLEASARSAVNRLRQITAEPSAADGSEQAPVIDGPDDPHVNEVTTPEGPRDNE